MKKTSKLLATFLAVIMIFTALPLGSVMSSAAGVTASGKTGDCTWSFSGDTLTISGSGNMRDYTWDEYAPWDSYRSSIKNVIIGDKVTSIGDLAFYKCTGLTSIEIPDSVKSIGARAFYGCTGLNIVTIGNSVESISNYAFFGCTGLTSIEIPDSVTSIGEGAFSGCAGLTNITIPDSVTSIGSSAFYECTGLKTVTIGNSVTSIGVWAFHSCTGLTSIEIPDSVTSIGRGAFYNTAWYNSKPDGLVYAGKVAYEYKGTMPSNTSIVLKDGTLGITDYVFSGRTGLTSIEIPDSVTSIGDSAFRGCTGLNTVTIGNSVKSIGDSAFWSCTGLMSIEIPDSVESIGSDAFYGTAWYNSKPDGLVYVGKVAYKYKGTMPSNTSIVLKDGTLGIAGFAFSGCTGLTSIEIPDSVTNIGEAAFDSCDGLTSIEIPDSVTSIGSCAFLCCDGLTSIEIPDSVTSIGNGAFECCTGLTSIEIPDSVTSIGNYAFDSCTGLTSIEIPDSVTSIGYDAFYNCTGLTSIEIPDSVTSIGDFAFYNCTGLKTVKYSGTKTQWSKISVGKYNECLSTAVLETLETPKNLTCTAYTKSTLTLSWDKVDGVKGYKIYNVTTGKSYKIKGADNTTYKIQNLKECKNYDFQICYFENDGTGDQYGEYSQSFRYCTRPSGVTVTELNNSSSGTKHSFTVTHTAVDNVSGYEVKYQKIDAKNYKTYIFNRTTADPKTIEVAKAGTYKVWIRAYKSAKYDGVNKFKANGDWSESYTIEVK